VLERTVKQRQSHGGAACATCNPEIAVMRCRRHGGLARHVSSAQEFDGHLVCSVPRTCTHAISSVHRTVHTRITRRTRPTAYGPLAPLPCCLCCYPCRCQPRPSFLPSLRGRCRVAGSVLRSKGAGAAQRLPHGKAWGSQRPRGSACNVTAEGQAQKKERNVPYTRQSMTAPSALRIEARGCRGGELGIAGRRRERSEGSVPCSSASQRARRERGGRKAQGVYASSSGVRERVRPAWGDRGASGRDIRKDGCETFSTPCDPRLDAPTVVKKADRERGEREVSDGRSRRAKAEITGQQRPAACGALGCEGLGWMRAHEQGTSGRPYPIDA
jgi:hypothetical protein